MAATPLKISMLIDSLCPGGAQRQFVSLANGLKKRGYEVTIFCYHENSFFQSALISDIPVRVAVGKLGILRKIGILREFAKTSADVAISFLETPNFLNLITCLVKPDVLRIVSERNLDPSKLSWRKRVLLLLYRTSDFIVANSFSQAQLLESRKAIRNKVRCIVNCVDTQRFTPESVNAGNRELGFRGIIVARYSLQKNVFLPIKWAAAHNRCPISFTWYGSEMCSEEGESVTLYQKAQAKLRDLNITTIKLCGSASNIENEYRRHDFLCLPSFYEGTANVICEGMACGLPILCSNISDNPSLVKEGVNGFLFDPTSLDSFDAAIGRFLKLRPEEFNRMRQVNRAKAVAWFSPDRFLDQWEAVIKSAQNPSKEQRTNTAAFAERCDAGSNNRNCS